MKNLKNLENCMKNLEKMKELLENLDKNPNYSDYLDGKAELYRQFTELFENYEKVDKEF